MKEQKRLHGVISFQAELNSTSRQENRSAAGNAGFRMPLRERQQVVDGVRMNFGIGIQEEHPLAVDQLHCFIVRASEAETSAFLIKST